MAGALSGLWSLGTAAVGLYWDVAWHIDFGRDRTLLLPAAEAAWPPSPPG